MIYYAYVALGIDKNMFEEEWTAIWCFITMYFYGKMEGIFQVVCVSKGGEL
jgi:hypothetical protein